MEVLIFMRMARLRQLSLRHEQLHTLDGSAYAYHYHDYSSLRPYGVIGVASSLDLVINLFSSKNTNRLNWECCALLTFRVRENYLGRSFGFSEVNVLNFSPKSVSRPKILPLVDPKFYF